MMDDRVEVTSIDIRSEVEVLLDDIEIVATATGHKSSEGDGRTAADIRREHEREADGGSD